MNKRGLLFLALILIFSSQLLASQKSLVRIYTQELLPKGKFPRGLDIAGAKPGEWIDVVIPEEELHKITQIGLRTEVLSWDIEALYEELKGEYHTYPEFVDSLEAIATNHPGIAMLDTLGVTYEGREILALKISDDVTVEEDEPEILFVGLHHAREWPSLETVLFYADTLTRAYGSDSYITQTVNSREIWLVPCLNPDGYVWCHDLGHDWRKNRRPVPGGIGIDLNRNYDGAVNGDPYGKWGSIPYGATSHHPGSEVYCGPSPFSEAETQAIRELVFSHDFIFAVSYHTYGEIVIWSWGYTYDSAPDGSLLSDIGAELASRITRQSGGGTYDAYQSSGLYPTTGDFDDWIYGFNLYAGGKNALSYTIELCNSFHPSAVYLDQIVRENFDGALYLCDIADSVAGLLTPRVMPPEISGMDTSYSPSYIISWSPKYPGAQATYYELEELSWFSRVTDEAETGSYCWDLQGFSLSTTRSHSPSHSYYSTIQSGNEVAAMTSLFPLPVEEADSLTFWCWYDIESEWDYAFVEVSLDSRKWDVLDFFTGSSGWVRKAYSLEEYAGSSIFIRFRYITDDYYEYEGFYVDDIWPVVYFDSVNILASDISDTSFLVTEREEGTYYYRVKGHNEERGWGDFSQLEDVVVMTPDSLMILGDTVVAGEKLTIPIIGVNSDSISQYSIRFYYNPVIFEIDSLTLQGTRAEGANVFDWNDTLLNDTLGQVTASVVYEPFIPPGRGPLSIIVIDVSPYAPPGTTTLDLTEGNFESRSPVLVDGDFVVLSGEEFIRGDVDSDMLVDMPDAVYILRYKFVPGSPPPDCMDAGDADDNGLVEMPDAVYILKYKFIPGSPPPPLPFPECGSDPTPDELNCNYHPCFGFGTEEIMKSRR